MSIQPPDWVGSIVPAVSEAQRLARRKRRETHGQTEETRRLREKLASHLAGLEDGDEYQHTDPGRIDAELPQRPTPGTDPVRPRRDHPETDASAESADAADAAPASNPAPGAPSRPLYRHLDVRG